jgi:ABC-type transporter Mla subunit MlaD
MNLKLKFNLKRTEMKVGLFILFPIVVLISIILFKLGYSLSSTTYDVYLKIDNIKAIKVGTSVRVKGFEIGRVVDISPVYKPSLHFLARMRVTNQLALYESCSAIIQNQNVIGDANVEIRNPDRPEEPLRDGDVLEGIEYVNIEALLQDVHSLLATATSTMSVVKDISVESKGNIRRLTADLSGSMGTVNSMLANSQRDFIDIMTSFRKTAQTMQEISVELKAHPMKFITK